MSNLPLLPRLNLHERQATSALASVTAVQAVLAACFLALCPLAMAQAPSASQAPAYGASGRIGLVVASMPTYEGSPNRRTLVAPDLTLSYRSRDWGSVEFGQRGLTWNAVEAGQFRLALVARFDLGRRDSDPPPLNPSPGDKRLAGMGKVPATTEAGVGIGYGPVMVVARQTVGERGPKGAQVDMSVEVPWLLSERLSLRAAVVATWANRHTLQTSFGVTPEQARATSFSVYTPKAGCRKVEASVGAEYALASDWKLQANVGFSRLGADAAASPLVRRRDGVSAALGMAREF